MTDKQEIRNEIGQTLQALSPFYQEGITKLFQEFDPPNSWFLLNGVRANEPEPFTAESAQALGPYASLQRHAERLTELTEAGLLTVEDNSKYQLTDKGRSLIEGFFNTAHEALADIEPLTAEDMGQVRDLLWRMVDESITSTEAEEKPALLASRWTDPGNGAANAALVDQYVTDLLRYRDDAHVAAWKPYGVEGMIWEAFSFVWQDRAGTAGELAEELPFRGYSEADYASALAVLSNKGWLEDKGGRYQTTVEGKQIREEAEVETDRIYFASWSVLSDSELDQLHGLLKQLNEQLDKAGLHQLWSLATDVSQAIFPVSRAAVNPVLQKRFGKPGLFMPTLLAIGRNPEPIGVEDYFNRSPYISPDRISQILTDASQEGYLDSGNGSGYRVTESGQEAMNEVNEVFYNYLGDISTLPEEDLVTLSGFLEQIVEASLNADEPSGKWGIENTRNSHLDKPYAPLAKIDQYLDDLNSFRDDTHIASWQGYSVSGRTWETLSYLWEGRANSAAELAEKLPFRGYGEEDYAGSLSELVEKGWVRKTADGMQITDEGRAIRLASEEKTDELFFGPWAVLDNGQQSRMRRLLISLQLSLEALAEDSE